MSKWRVLENFEVAVLRATDVFLQRQRRVVAKSIDGLYVVILGVEFNHLKTFEGFHQFFCKEEEMMKKDMVLSLNDRGVLFVSWKIHDKTHWVLIPPGEQALVDRNRFIVKTFFYEEESKNWLDRQIESCNTQLQDDQAESGDPSYFM